MGKLLALQQKEIIKQLTMSILHQLVRHPDITLHRKELDDWNKNNSWPTGGKINLYQTIKYKGIWMVLKIDTENALYAFNNQGIPQAEKEYKNAQEEWEKNSFCVDLTVAFPNVVIPVKRNRRYYSYQHNKYISEQRYDTLNKDVTKELRGSYDEWMETIAEAYKSYLDNKVAAKTGEQKKKIFEEAAEVKRKEEEAKQKAAEKAAAENKKLKKK